MARNSGGDSGGLIGLCLFIGFIVGNVSMFSGDKEAASYMIPIDILVVIAIIVFSGGKGFGSIEKDMVNAAKNYISSNNVKVNGEIYIELDKLGEIEGTELCYKSSGVIVKSENGR